MLYVYIGAGIIVFAVIIYVLFFRQLPPYKPSHTSEIPKFDDIYKIIENKRITANKSIILGVDKGIVIFDNDKVVYKDEGYSVNYDSIVDFFESEELFEDNKKSKRKNKKEIIEDIEPKSIMTCYNVRTGPIKDIEINLNNNNFFFDNFYNILVQLGISLRASYEVINYEIFIRDVAQFKNIYSLDNFKAFINEEIKPKVYSSISLYIKKHDISYLHISLYKHEIEQTVILELNEFLKILGLKMIRLTFTNISIIEDEYFERLSKGILEKSKMMIIGYSYEDKMNDELEIIEDELNIDDTFKETNLFIKDRR